MEIKKTKKMLLPHSLFYGMLLIAIALLPIKTSAIGQTTDPIVIKNALRGKEYQQTMTVVNTEKTNSKIGFSAEGQIDKWASFYKQGDFKTQIGDITMKPGEVRNITVLFAIPSDTPNGEYKGFISAIKKSDAVGANNGSSASVSQKIDRKVTITVNDKEIVAFEVSVIPKTYDLKKGETLSIRLIYDNRGNVSITPQAQIKIKKDSQAVYNTIFLYPENQPAVRPGDIFEIPAIEIPTSNFEKGRYVAEMVFLEKGKEIFSKNFGFSADMINDSGANGSAALAGGANGNNIVKGISNSNLLLSLILAGLAGIGLIFVSKKTRLQKIKNDDEKK